MELDFVKSIFEGDKAVLNDEETLHQIQSIVDRFLKVQNIEQSQIKQIGMGCSSRVFKIGDYVLKIGGQRARDEIPSHRRILKSIVMEKTNSVYKKGVPRLVLEVQEETDANWYEGMSEQEINNIIYSVYADIRKDNICWLDTKKENIGRLLKPNKINNSEKLSDGEYVVIDKDCIIPLEREKDFPKKSMSSKFELRYRKEHNILQRMIDTLKNKFKHFKNNIYITKNDLQPLLQEKNEIVPSPKSESFIKQLRDFTTSDIQHEDMTEESNQQSKINETTSAEIIEKTTKRNLQEERKFTK